MLTVERLREVLAYNVKTGEFSWRIKPRGVKQGAKVGGLDSNGYWRIGIDGKRYVAHRLAWFYVHGEWPMHEIDHKDRDRLNNRLGNLRSATRSQNAANSAPHNGSLSGLKGVAFYKPTGRWIARVQAGKKRVSLGYFPTAEEAHKAYCRAAVQIHGEFARVSS